MYARNFDPELEKIRESALQPQNEKTVILNQRHVASQVHASYLFEHEGRQLLQKLCLFLSATASGKSYADWKKFGIHLGLTTEQIKCIDYDFKGLQDPTYYVLLAFAQGATATMDKIFSVLEEIQRLDVINQISDSFTDFYINITQNQSSNLKNGIYKPNVLPRAPLVLNSIIKSGQKTNQNITREIYNTNKKNTTNDNVKKKYGSITLLTFAEDGRKTAEEIAKIFRSKDPKIGVIILQEQEKHVYCKAEEFIEDCFKQVNYIVPILTVGYINKINNYVYDEYSNNNLDSKYLRYIFSLLRYEYVKQDCVNNRVRCIIPDSEVRKVLSLDIHPTLQAWFRESDAHLFTERILLQKF